MKSKRYIILLTIIIVFFIVIYLLIGRNFIKKGKEKAIFIIGNSSIWTYEQNTWYSTGDIQDLMWKDFVLYDEGKKVGTYQVWKDSDKWHYFDKEKTEKRTNGKTLAIKSNFDIDVHQYKEEKLQENDNNIKYVLEDNNLDINSKFKSRYKINIDYDRDGITEIFYIISNVFLGDTNNKKISIAFMVKESKLYYLYKSIDSSKSYYYGCLPYYNYFLDLNADKTDEIILSCARYSNNKTTDMLYEYNKEDNSFKIIFSNQ